MPCVGSESNANLNEVREKVRLTTSNWVNREAALWKNTYCKYARRITFCLQDYKMKDCSGINNATSSTLSMLMLSAQV